ncbi:FAD-dependent oxidoreductase [Actinomadura atramentaria]|uniref:FAD-dependent oxidoreductase n=1 Tax=Actinomadura atramentaria TaxID=1990 RepID=UPI0003729B23|nr:NAD(P)/FAD-dependent oxidoreductase [Actinomadura atramentaria]
MTKHQPIIIAGAGLGGLVLARVLHVHGVEAALYDLDASRAARPQGGMLDLHEESGQAALRAAGLHEGFEEIIFPGGDAMRVLGKDAAVRLADDGGGERPEVKRGDLRDLLLDALPDGAVRWNSKIVEARPLDGGRHEVTLADGETLTTDLLVGADGAWSRVRRLVSDAVPAYAGISFVELNLYDADVRHPRAAAVIGSGLMFALAEEKGFLAHREPDGNLHVYAALRAPAEWTAAVDFADTASAKAELLTRFAGWHDDLRGLIADADGPLVPRQIHALPVGHRWEPAPGVTLLGDAAHLMSPFAGDGANLAMLDGAELAAAIVARPGGTEAAVAAYEAAMFERSEAAAAESAANLEVCFAPDAPDGLVALMEGYTA